MERPVKLYYGSPERESLCRITKADIEASAKRVFRYGKTKAHVRKALDILIAEDAEECVPASDRAFAAFAGITFADLGVIMRYQEALVYKCEKWRQ